MSLQIWKNSIIRSSLHKCVEKQPKYNQPLIQIFNKLGGILDKAFTDIHDKCNIVKRNYEMHKDYHNAMLPFIKLEI